MKPTMSDAELEALLERISNWGRWGKEDQRGALNYIDDSKRAAAARMVESGHTVRCRCRSIPSRRPTTSIPWST